MRIEGEIKIKKKEDKNCKESQILLDDSKEKGFQLP